MNVNNCSLKTTGYMQYILTIFNTDSVLQLNYKVRLFLNINLTDTYLKKIKNK